MSEDTPTPAAAATPAVLPLSADEIDAARKHATCGCGVGWPESFVQGLLAQLDAATARADADYQRALMLQDQLGDWAEQLAQERQAREQEERISGMHKERWGVACRAVNELQAALATERARGERLAKALQQIIGLNTHMTASVVARAALADAAPASPAAEEPVFIGGADIDWSQIPPGRPGSIEIEPAQAEPDPTAAATKTGAAWPVGDQ